MEDSPQQKNPQTLTFNGLKTVSTVDAATANGDKPESLMTMDGDEPAEPYDDAVYQGELHFDESNNKLICEQGN